MSSKSRRSRLGIEASPTTTRCRLSQTPEGVQPNRQARAAAGNRQQRKLLAPKSRYGRSLPLTAQTGPESWGLALAVEVESAFTAFVSFCVLASLPYHHVPPVGVWLRQGCGGCPVVPRSALAGPLKSRGF